MAQIPPELKIVTLALAATAYQIERMHDLMDRMNTIEPHLTWETVAKDGYLKQLQTYRQNIDDWVSALEQLWRIYGTDTT